MLIPSGSIKVDAHTEQVSFQTIEGTIRECMSDTETAPMIDAGNTADGIDKRCLLLVGEGLDGAEFELPGDGDEERDAVDVHDIGT